MMRALITAAVALSLLAVPATAAAHAPAPPPSDGVAIVSHRPRGVQRTDDAAGGTYIARFAAGVTATDEARSLRHAGVTVYDTYEHVFQGALVDVDAGQLAALRADPRILSIEPDGPTQIAGARTGAVQGAAPWGLDRIDQRNLPLSGTYEYQYTGAGVVAYVLDSGVNGGHADFGGRVDDGAWLQPLYSGPGDCNGHGTHVAGIIGSNTYGVAKRVTIYPLRVFDCNGTAASSDVILALDYIVDNHPAGQPAVLNMSNGGLATGAEDAAVQAVIDDGVTVTASAGNDGVPACNQSPARVPAAITVAATDSTDTSPTWSNYGTCVDLFAPGDSITSLSNLSATGTSVMSGTSMSSPFVAGAAALLLEQAPDAPPAQVAAQLVAQATPNVVANARPGSPNLLLFAPPPGVVLPATAGYLPMNPARLLDTRPGYPTIDGQFAGIGPRGAGVITEVQVAGRAGVPADATTASLNITVTEAQAPGFVTVFPCGRPVPTASNLNYTAGDTVPNAVITQIGAGGLVCLFTYATTHLVADINGYFPAGAPYAPTAPARLLDTRPGYPTIDGQLSGIGARGTGWVTVVPVAGRGGVPANATTASLNITVAESAEPGFVTVYPCGLPIPTASNLNFGIGDTRANAVLTQIGAGGRVCLFTYAPTQLIVDVSGYFPPA